MAYTQQDLNALNSAIVSGHLRVEYDGKKVEFRSLSDLIKIRDMVAAELAPTSQSTAQQRQFYPSFSKGLR